MKDVYGIGVLGLGIIGQMIASELVRSPRFEVIAAFDPVAPEAPTYRMLPTPQDVVNHPQVDCVYVASPPQHHAQGVELTVAARKAILCEKPLAASVAVADRLAALVVEAGIPNAVNFAFPTLATGRAMADAVDRRLLGTVQRGHLRLRFWGWPQRWHAGAGAWLSSPNEGGFTREVATHFLALADRLLGPGVVRESRVERGPDGLETRTRATLDFGGVPFDVDAALDASVDRPDDMTSMFTLECTDGTMSIENWTTAVGIPVQHTGASGIDDALAALLDGETNDLRDFAAAARVVRLVESILASNQPSSG